MTTKVYVVNGSNGEYSDRCDWNICACLTEERANEIVDKLERLQTFNKEFRIRTRTEFDEVYARENPQPERDYPERAAINERFRVLSSRKKENDAERAEFHALNKEHLAKIKGWEAEVAKFTERQRDWYKTFAVAQEAWIKENFNPPEDLKEVVGLSAEGRFGVDVVDLWP